MNAGRSALAIERGQVGDRVGVGRRAATDALVDRRHVARRRAEHVEREVEERRAAMRRHRQAVPRRGPSRPPALASFTVTADLVIDATTGTWSSSCSEPAPQRSSGARPPSTTSGEPLN